CALPIFTRLHNQKAPCLSAQRRGAPAVPLCLPDPEVRSLSRALTAPDPVGLGKAFFPDSSGVARLRGARPFQPRGLSLWRRFASFFPIIARPSLIIVCRVQVADTGLAVK